MSAGPQGFALPKEGNAEADYEDAYAISADSVAIADGATESSFARAWAEALVGGFSAAKDGSGSWGLADEGEPPDGTPAADGQPNGATTQPTSSDPTVEGDAGRPAADPAAAVPPTDGDAAGAPRAEEYPWSADSIRRDLVPLQSAWHESIAWDRLPWFAEDKARKGAFSALLAFRLEAAAATDLVVGERQPTGGADPIADGEAGAESDPADETQATNGSQPSSEEEPAGEIRPADGDQAAVRDTVESEAAVPAAPLEHDTDRGWYAFAIGDCCMFQIRDDALVLAFPMESAEQFNSRPLLLSSNPDNNRGVWDSIAFGQGDCRDGDVFLFATDALAHWILAESEGGRRPWRTLCALRSLADFADLVARLRHDRAMRNDDVTLVRLTVPEAAG